MQLQYHILLTGFMGAGKTRVGKYLAELLQVSFFDLDHVISQKEEISVSAIFSRKGEEYFRRTEAKILCELLLNNNSVISLGGGTLHNSFLKLPVNSNFKTIYLNTPKETILNRLEGSRKRPLLLNDDGTLKNRQELSSLIDTLFFKRQEIYSKSDIIYTPELNETSKKVAQNIYTLLSQNGK